MRIHNFNSYKKINEQNSDYQELIDAVSELVRATVDKTGGEYDQLLDSFLSTPDDTNIEGLINDADVYDFYILHRAEIDALLNEVGYYGETPETMGVFGLYDYVVTGTRRALEETVRMMTEK
jgi:hypothetical protein